MFHALAWLMVSFELVSARVIRSRLLQNEQVGQADQGLQSCRRTGLECLPYVIGQEMEAVALRELGLV